MAIPGIDYSPDRRLDLPAPNQSIGKDFTPAPGYVPGGSGFTGKNASNRSAEAARQEAEKKRLEEEKARQEAFEAEKARREALAKQQAEYEKNKIKIEQQKKDLLRGAREQGYSFKYDKDDRIIGIEDTKEGMSIPIENVGAIARDYPRQAERLQAAGLVSAQQETLPTPSVSRPSGVVTLPPTYKDYIRDKNPVTATKEYIFEKARGAIIRKLGTREDTTFSATLLTGEQGERISQGAQTSLYFVPGVGLVLLGAEGAGQIFTQGGRAETASTAQALQSRFGVPSSFSKVGIYGISGLSILPAGKIITKGATSAISKVSPTVSKTVKGLSEFYSRIKQPAPTEFGYLGRPQVTTVSEIIKTMPPSRYGLLGAPPVRQPTYLESFVERGLGATRRTIVEPAIQKTVEGIRKVKESTEQGVRYFISERERMKREYFWKYGGAERNFIRLAPMKSEARLQAELFLYDTRQKYKSISNSISSLAKAPFQFVERGVGATRRTIINPAVQDVRNMKYSTYLNYLKAKDSANLFFKTVGNKIKEPIIKGISEFNRYREGAKRLRYVNRGYAGLRFTNDPIQPEILFSIKRGAVKIADKLSRPFQFVERGVGATRRTIINPIREELERRKRLQNLDNSDMYQYFNPIKERKPSIFSTYINRIYAQADQRRAIDERIKMSLAQEETGAPFFFTITREPSTIRIRAREATQTAEALSKFATNTLTSEVRVGRNVLLTENVAPTVSVSEFAGKGTYENSKFVRPALASLSLSQEEVQTLKPVRSKAFVSGKPNITQIDLDMGMDSLSSGSGSRSLMAQPIVNLGKQTQEQSSIVKVIPRLKDSLSSGSRSLNRTRNLQRALSISRTRQGQRKALLGISSLPKADDRNQISSLLGKVRKAYTVITYKGGKEQILGKGLPIGLAKKLGAKNVLGTLRASFKLKPTGTTTQEDIEYTLPGKFFRPSKRDADRFVQIRNTRLSARPETKEIVNVRRSKGRKIKWF